MSYVYYTYKAPSLFAVEFNAGGYLQMLHGQWTAATAIHETQLD